MSVFVQQKSRQKLTHRRCAADLSKKATPVDRPGRKIKSRDCLEELVENEGEKLTRKMIELAKGGNVRSLEFCLDRLLPQRRGQPINLPLPKINSVMDVAPTMAALLEAIGNGTITPEEASPVISLLNSYMNASITADVADRLEKVESVLKVKGKM